MGYERVKDFVVTAIEFLMAIVIGSAIFSILGYGLVCLAGGCVLI